MERYRSWLFAPGDVADRCLKALHSAADQVIWDLEDAVPIARKGQARDTILRLLAEVPGDRVPWIRINDLEDLSALGPHRRWVVPKMDQTRLEQLHRQVPTVLKHREWVFIIESARGLWDLSHAVTPWHLFGDPIRLAFGSLDYLNDIGAQATPEELELLGPRTLLPWVSRAWEWSGPIDTVFPYLDDQAQFTLSTQRARTMGFQGRFIIHPQQIAPVNRIFMPSKAEQQWAQKIITQSEQAGAVRLEGEMVDRPVLERARRILETAKPQPITKEDE